MFKVGDLVQTKQATSRGVGERAFTLAAGWLGIVLDIHPTGSYQVRFSKLLTLNRPCELWIVPSLLGKASD